MAFCVCVCVSVRLSVLRPLGAAGGPAAALHPGGRPRQGGQELEAAAELPAPRHSATGVCAHLPVGGMYVSPPLVV